MPADDKTIERLTRAMEAAYNSPGKVFWRGFLQGLGRGLGTLVGFLLLLGILFYLFKLSGLEQTFQNLIDTLSGLQGSAKNIPFR